jgi:hypothetical protein
VALETLHADEVTRIPTHFGPPMSASQFTIQNAMDVKTRLEQCMVDAIPHIMGYFRFNSSGMRFNPHALSDTLRACVWMWVHRFRDIFDSLKCHFPQNYCITEVRFNVLGHSIPWCTYSDLLEYITHYVSSHMAQDVTLINRWRLLMDMGGEKSLPDMYDMVRMYVREEGSSSRPFDTLSHSRNYRRTPYLDITHYTRFMCDFNCQTPAGLNFRCQRTGRVLPPIGNNKQWLEVSGDRSILRVFGDRTFSSLVDVMDGVHQYFLDVHALLQNGIFAGQSLVTFTIGEYLGLRQSHPLIPYERSVSKALVRSAASELFGSGFPMSSEVANRFLNQQSVMEKVTTLMREQACQKRFAWPRASSNWVAFSCRVDALPVLLAALFEHDPLLEARFNSCLARKHQVDREKKSLKRKANRRGRDHDIPTKKAYCPQ